MKIRSSALLTALLLSLVAAGAACASRSINTQDAQATSPASSGKDGSSIPAAWKRYDFDKPIALSLILPGTPEERGSTIIGGTEKSHVYLARGGSGVYGLKYIDNLPSVARRAEEDGNEFFYDLFIKEFALKMQSSGQDKSAGPGAAQFKVTSEKPVVVSGFEGLERDFSLGSLQGRAQLARMGQAAVCLVAIWEPTAPAAEQEAFFKSFKVSGEGH